MEIRQRKWGLSVLCMVVLFAVMLLSGCGKTPTKEEMLAEMTEFSSPDGSVTLKMDKDWKTEDMGVDTAFAAGEKDGSEGMLLMQFPKNGMYTVESIDDMKKLMEENYHMTDIKAEDAIEIPGLSGIEVVSCKMNSGGQKGEFYLAYGESEYAFYTIGYLSGKINDKMKVSFQASCSTFHEEAPEEEDRTTAEMSDTIRWFNASYAVLTELNGWDYNRFAGLPANDTTMELEIESLKEWWDVTDRASADETLEWILAEGHRAGFAENMAVFEESGLGNEAAEDRVDFILDNFSVDAEEAESYAAAYALYEGFGEHAIDGWDYCRAMNLLSFYYLAGYYTEEESLDKSLEIAQMIQTESGFESWDDLMDSYLRGYEYWAEESSDERRAVYEDLKGREDNPYAVDFKMTLEKTW